VLFQNGIFRQNGSVTYRRPWAYSLKRLWAVTPEFRVTAGGTAIELTKNVKGKATFYTSPHLTTVCRRIKQRNVGMSITPEIDVEYDFSDGLDVLYAGITMSFKRRSSIL